jgi:hypothetical protein
MRLSMRAPLSTSLTPLSLKMGSPVTTLQCSAMSVTARRKCTPSSFHPGAVGGLRTAATSVIEAPIGLNSEI